jgi:hypothetical protein
MKIIKSIVFQSCISNPKYNQLRPAFPKKKIKVQGPADKKNETGKLKGLFGRASAVAKTTSVVATLVK